MSTKIKLLFFLVLFSFCVSAQVKIGENPNIIDSASIVELESSDKALVLTRLTTAQMQAINPLNGAVVYNTDTQCVHYYNGLIWTNLCDGNSSSSFSFADNGNGTITLSDGNGNNVTFNGASQTISTLADNGDGTYTYTNENGIETIISIVSTDNQNLQTDNTPGNISIDNGNAIAINVDDADADDQNEIQTLNYTSGVLTLSNDPNATTVDLSAFDQNAADDFSGSFNDLSDLPANLDTDATDDFNTGISFDGTNLTVSDAGGDVSTNISGLAYDDTAIRADVDQNELDADNAIAAVDTKIDNHIIADEDTSATNELSDLSLDASNILTLTNPATGTNEVDLSGYVSTDDQNLESATLSGASELGINIEGGNDVTVDLSALEESADITAVQDDVNQNELDADNAIAAVDTKIDNHIIADEDTSATNELSDLSLSATNMLTLTNAEAGATGVDLSGYVSTDDQNLESATLSSASELGINIEGGDDVTVDLSALEESADITAVQDDVNQNELDADNAIAAVDTKIDNHIIADEDTSATNELSDLSLSATNMLTLTNAEAGAAGVDLSGYVSTDDQNLESATLSSASELGINIEGGDDVTVDLSALEESADITAVQDDVNQNELDADNAIAAVDTKIDNHIITDEDTSATNELSDLSLSATNILTLTNAEAGATGVDLSGYVSTDDQNLESATLSGASELGINIEGGNDVTVDLSALEESADITAVQNDVDQNELDADNAIAAVDTKIDNHIIADEDVSATNELSDLSLDASNILTLTNPATGTNEVDLSGFVSTDDQNLESATLSSASELGINIEGGNDVTVDLSALEESADITAVDNKVDAHILSDEDTSATNELSDLNLDASNILTLSNPATGTNEVDLSGFVSTDDQNLESATLSSDSELGINIEGGNDVTVDLSALEESADITAVQNDVDQNELDADNAIAAVDTKIDNHIIADEDTSATNELSDLSLDASNILTLTNPATGTNEVDLSGFVSTDDQNLESATLSGASELGINIEGGDDVTVNLSALEESADITAVDNKVDAHILADEDVSATNELSDLSLSATNMLTLTNAEAGATGVDLSGYVSTDDQNLESATLSGASELGINIEGGNDVTVDLSALEESADITAVQNDVDQNELDADNAIAAVDTKIDNHIIADEDVSATNELSDLSLDASNILTLTNPATGTNEVDLSGFVSTDDQNLESATLSSASELGINIEGGNDVTVDLSALEESADITAVQNDVDQNELDADNAIAAVDTKIDNHIIADEDTSATNELSDLSLSATNILTLTNAEAGAAGVDLSGYVSTDDQNLESATLSGASELGINIEGGNDVTVDLSALEESADITAVQNDVDQNELDADNAIAAVDTKIDNHIIADEDVSATNELSDLSLDASNILTLTNPATGTNEVDLSGFVSTDDQNLESATLSSASELGINIEGGNDVTVDLSALEESADITAVQNDVDQNELDADNAIAAVDTKIDNHIIADEDTSATNELSDLSLDASNILTLTNPATGTNEIDLSGFVSTDDQNLESATLSSASELGINIEGGNDVTVDLSALEESADITAVQDDVNQNELDADNAIAAVDTKIDNHIIADEDTSATNELSDLSLSATNMLTLTNAEAGAAGVDLSGYVSTDDQNLESATLSGASELGINIEGGDDVTVDLSALEESADITAVQDDVNQNELDADNAIAAVDTKIDNHIIADEDTSATNELSDLSLSATNILTLTNAEAGAAGVDLSGYVSTDDQNLESATLSGASELGINIEGGDDVTVDLSALEESADITAVDNKVDAHILADEDVSATNELSDLSLSATNILTLTNPATGTNQVDLSTVSTDDQTVEMFAFNGSTFELLLKIEDDPTTQVANLSSLYADGTETVITAGTGIQILGDGSSSLPYTITNVFTEIDGSVTNETNTSFSTVDVAGTDYLRISDSNGDLDVPLSDLSHTGTTGSIFFADTDGTPTENNGQLFWDNTNNRLSIGNPLAGTNKLTVNGATRTSGLNNSDGTLSLPSYRFSDDSDTGTYSPAADEIGLVVGGIEALKVEETSNKTSVIINETLELEGTVLDKNDSAGTARQVLSSTATGTEWVDNYNPVKAIGKISSTGTVTKATAGVTVARISVGYYRVTLPAGSVSDADYIIQLSQPGRNGVGNDDPGISYSNQTATSFEVIIGDNDNGGTDRSRFDSEFMFTILDL